MRPKSSVTVVVVLAFTSLVSSTPIETEVISASVISGSISDIEPTNVVLPTPKPPLITIFTAIGMVPERLSERLDMVSDPLDDVQPKVLLVLVVAPDVPGVDQIRDQNPGHANR